ncbi:lipoprotein insertase outer membrane protein LolB [Massilia endophytica]|uniref:lipoprotein insertase outer membrane protein LolB n=1 Tax=Massilia endophytica TaxID=2899220 RepID=UPI001E3C4749|nr:lipoprotein insertase outer membrane protein LolB [Massilia endophytica]UGQ46786.1 lipoprotein insertase outer membrane protein LolB [Massilia endophytica]
MLKPAIAILSLSGALLAGCASTGGGTSSTAAVAPYREALTLSGRMSASYTRDGTPGSVTVKFDWRQTPQRTDITLYDPLGSTIATIAVTQNEAVLIQNGKEPRSADSIDALTAQTFGWPLPVSGLREWLQGHATAENGQRFTASAANSSVTTRDGWQLNFVSWQENSDPPKPKRIDLERAASGPVTDITIRIALDAAN